ncbi:MAG: precorrin-6y C5,15-methyltransferase (decarboxylating) subunit CbiE [Magnetococcales bacterium]|nr:precorrin-6y C5,15-methyltransferase (decarboxylating) subunit CbiE [Magnetococcales bacterium]
MKHAVTVLGVLDTGPEDLSGDARRRLSQAELVLGEERFLTLYAPLMAHHAEKRSYSHQIAVVPQWILAAQRDGLRVVVLATGDPLFFGLAAFLKDRLPEGTLEVVSGLSTMQLAFARLTLPWSRARFVSLHARDGGAWHPLADFDHPLYPLWQSLREAELVGVLTGPHNTPQRIAHMLLSLGLGDRWLLHVAQRLGMSDERVARGLSPDAAMGQAFSEPNVVVLQRRSDVSDERLPLIGLPDEFYQKKVFSRGLITHREVRVLSLAQLAICDGNVVWDIGAGSGSVGLEAAGLTPNGQVWAIEKNRESLDHIQANRSRLGRYNYRLHHGVAPEGLERWPDPDALFIGGSGGGLESLLDLALKRLKPGGRLVLNLVTLENVVKTLTWMDQYHHPWSMTQTGCARSQSLLHFHRLEPQSPVWIITVVKEGHTR